MIKRPTPALIEKIRKGDPITDQELDLCLAFYHRVTEDLYALGPHFRLAWKETYTIYSRLDSYKQARKARG